MANSPYGEAADAALKMLQAELQKFEKRNQKKFDQVRDLTLCMRSCKTPEVKQSLSSVTARVLDEINREVNLTNKNIQKGLALKEKEAEKKRKAELKGKAKEKGSGPAPLDTGQQKAAKAKLEVELQKMFGRLPPSLIGSVEAKPKSKEPYIDYKQSIFSLGLRF